MAQASTLYRFRLELSDVDRGVYESLDFRIAMHPSETEPFLLTRVLAFALNWTPSLEFTPGGLSDPEEPAVRELGPQGSIDLWIEVGSPSARKLHKATKASARVKVYTYKDPRLLLDEIQGAKVYQAERIEIYSIAPRFLETLAAHLARDNTWSLLHTDGSVTIGTKTGEPIAGEIHTQPRPSG